MKKNTFHCIFWPCLAVFFGVLGWLSYAILNLESQRVEDASRKWMEEQTRLALWRMDTSLTSLLSRENNRGAQEYFFLTDVKKGEHSPLFFERPEYVRMHFQITPDRNLISPQLPDEESRKIAGINTIPDREERERAFAGLKDADLLARILEKSRQEQNPDHVAALGLRPPSMDAFMPPRGDTVKEQVHEPLPKGIALEPARQISREDQFSQIPSGQQNNVSGTHQSEIDFEIRNALNQDVQKLASQSSRAQLAESSSFNKLANVKQEVKKIAELNREKKEMPAVPESIGSEGKDRKRMALGKRDDVQHDKGKSMSDCIVQASEAFFENQALEKNASMLHEPDTVMMGESALSLPDKNTKAKNDVLGLPVEQSNDLFSWKGKEILEIGDTEEKSEVSISENFISISAFVPYWIKEDLYLLRTVRANSDIYIQGVVIDWEKLKNMLLGGTADLIPDARLLPYDDSRNTQMNVSRLLSVLPVVVDPRAFSGLPQNTGLSTIKLTLYLAWAFALAAVAGVVLLLAGALKLSERRATFVSAVTHELRTPLTTFNLYTEMLMEGLVPEHKRNDYFNTLRREATRLTHMVDNVLSFSRIEKTRTQRHFERVSVQELRDIIVRHISPRLKEAGMEAQDTITPGAAGHMLETDTTAVEQIFYNFADNVAKYASKPGSSVELHMFEDNKRIVICFRDHGTGLPPSVKKKLFKPFSRSAEEAAGKKPGVGLGLALSREIARDLGGDLKLDQKVKSGTAFLLYLPLDNK